MGLFSSNVKPTEPAVDKTAMVNTYASNLWIVQNRHEIIMYWCCAPESQPSGTQSSISTVALALSHFTAKRLWQALTQVVRQYENDYGELESDHSHAGLHAASFTADHGNLELATSQAEQPLRGPMAQPAAGSNFCTVSVSPEELILDFGMNTQMSAGGEPVKFTNRLVMSFYTAKSAMDALRKVIQDHERRYGELELDFQKRLRRRN